jgi:hypothetical protein
MHLKHSTSRRHFTLAAALLATAALAPAAEKKGFAIEKSAGGLVVKLDGQLFTEYVTLSQNKPILWPIIGPTGKEMTRRYPMDKVEGEQHDHPHHRSFYFGHQNISGLEFWHDRSSFEGPKTKEETLKAKLAHLGVTRHREFKETSATADQATIVSINDYVAFEGGKKIMEDVRRFTFRADADSRTVDVSLEFHNTTQEPVVFTDMKDAGFSLRLPTSMALTSKQGGKIINSEGVTDKDTWAKRAKWVDYHGPVNGDHLGVAFMEHPTSFRHPTPWHVRDYGLFTANAFGSKSLDKNLPDAPHTLKPGEKLLLRYRVIFHKGDEKAAKIAQRYEQFAKEK